MEAARESVRLRPGSISDYTLCLAYINLNRLDEAEAVMKQAGELELGSFPGLSPLRISFPEGRYGTDDAVSVGGHGKAGLRREVFG